MAYVFAGEGSASRRLEKINDLFFPSTKKFLMQQAPKSVNLLIDLGCAAGYTTRSLSSIIDAREYIGLDNCEYFIKQAVELNRNYKILYKLFDVTSPLPVKNADIMYSRFLLTHLKSPQKCIIDWSAHLKSGGMMFIEETESIKTGVRVFRDYIKISESLLKSCGNILFIGKLIGDFDYEGDLEKKNTNTACVRAKANQAAEIFLLNIPSLMNNDFIKDNHSGDIAEIEQGLEEIIRAGDESETIEWEIRQLCLMKC